MDTLYKTPLQVHEHCVSRDTVHNHHYIQCTLHIHLVSLFGSPCFFKFITCVTTHHFNKTRCTRTRLYICRFYMDIRYSQTPFFTNVTNASRTFTLFQFDLLASKKASHTSLHIVLTKHFPHGQDIIFLISVLVRIAKQDCSLER